MNYRFVDSVSMSILRRIPSGQTHPFLKVCNHFSSLIPKSYKFVWLFFFCPHDAHVKYIDQLFSFPAVCIFDDETVYRFGCNLVCAGFGFSPTTEKMTHWLQFDANDVGKATQYVVLTSFI